MSEFEFEVHLLDGSISVGHGADDYVRWNCVCSAAIDFLSSSAFGVTGGMRIDCPSCERKYFAHGYVPSFAGDQVFEINLDSLQINDDA